jgi:N-acetylglucosamine kinase-like BadF-type ATPase
MNISGSAVSDFEANILYEVFPHDRDGDYLVFVGVDGGGTGTDCLVRIVDAEKHAAGVVNLDDTETGVVVTTHTWTGAANANSVGFEQALANVTNAIFLAVDCALYAALRDKSDDYDTDDAEPLVSHAWVGNQDTESLFRRGTCEHEREFLEITSGGKRKRPRLCGYRYRFRLAGVALGIAGCDSPASQKRWRDALLTPPRKVSRDCAFAPETLVVENDAIIALARATRGTARGGALLVAGTGTIAFAVSYAGTRARTMGFGPAFDDPGSGHWLGTKALALTAKALDRCDREYAWVKGLGFRDASGEDGVIEAFDAPAAIRVTRAVLTKLGFAVSARIHRDDNVEFDLFESEQLRDARREDLTRWAYEGGPAPAWDRVASLAPILLRESERDDCGMVAGIVRDGANALAENLVVAIDRARDGESARDEKTPFVISLVGGLFNGETSRYAEEVKRRTTALLRRRFEGDRLKDERYVFYEDRATRTCGDVGGPMAGAVAMAAEAFEEFEERRGRNPNLAPVSAVSRT